MQLSHALRSFNPSSHYSSRSAVVSSANACASRMTIQRSSLEVAIDCADHLLKHRCAIASCSKSPIDLRSGRKLYRVVSMAIDAAPPLSPPLTQIRPQLNKAAAASRPSSPVAFACPKTHCSRRIEGRPRKCRQPPARPQGANSGAAKLNNSCRAAAGRQVAPLLAGRSVRSPRSWKKNLGRDRDRSAQAARPA